MTARELREKYLKFFESRGHTIIPSASLIPRETDASTLFTTAGMHPLVPYLLGEQHPGGKRVVNVQKCVRTGDIDEVGDNRHLTFFEMMGNWSFGDYFKKEAIEWSFEFLTDEKWLGLDKSRLYVTVFRGEEGIPRDEESIAIWKNVFKNAGIKAETAEDENIKNNVRIIPLGVEDNFWIAGKTGPCGGDTEIFYDTKPEDGKLEGKFSDLVNSGRLIEIWNDVFMEFNKKEDGTIEKLEQRNVDTGMGLERTLAVLNGKEKVFETELFQPIFEKIKKDIPVQYYDNKTSYRIVADHIKASVFIISDGVIPSNVQRGYVLRRLIRRSILHGKLLGLENNFTKSIAETVIDIYGNFYKELEINKDKIFKELEKEESKFRTTLKKGLRLINKLKETAEWDDGNKKWKTDFLRGETIFKLHTEHGFPPELIKEEMERMDLYVAEGDWKEYEDLFKKHQKLSQTASSGMFKGGLQDTSEETKKLHTAAHLMLAGLRKVLGEHVTQKGSNITAERLRFDFSHPEKMTPEQIKQVEDFVNDAIGQKLEVICDEMTLEEAKAQKAMGVFESKYGDKVKVYKIGDISNEICGGPHVKNTGELGHFKIQKEESSSAGVRRIKAILAKSKHY